MEDVQVFECTGSLFAIVTIRWSGISVEYALVSGSGLRVLLLDGEVLPEGQPVGGGVCRLPCWRGWPWVSSAAAAPPLLDGGVAGE